MSGVKTYEIGGTVYEQRALVLGQWRQLQQVLEGLKVEPVGGSLTKGLVAALEPAGRLDRALAVVLTEQGKSLRDKDLSALAERLEFSITPEQIAEVIDDFFTCNPASSILSRLGGVLVTVVKLLMGAMAEIGSKKPSSFLQEETGPSGTPFSGDALPQEPGPGCATGDGK